jgi:hypothetical protein
MATFGGPVTVTPGNTELGLAFGGYGEILSSPCIHADGEDWVVRFRRGVSDRIDLGLDFATTNQTDGSLGGTGKLAVRYRFTDGFRLEGGLGVADGGDSGDVNGDVAAVIGTHNPNNPIRLGITIYRFVWEQHAVASIAARTSITHLARLFLWEQLERRRVFRTM